MGRQKNLHLNIQKITDLHLHSNASDGLFTPTRIINLARENGLSAVALTDHETMEGIAEAWEAGKRLGVEVVPGVEISAGYQGRELHLLGYLPDINSKLDGLLSKLREGRFVRMEKMISRLSKISIEISRQDIKNETGEAAPGRLHLARAIQKKGYVREVRDAFELYIGKDRPGYIPRLKLKITEAIEILLDCGAVPVLAHPGITGEGHQTLSQLKSKGLMGIEVFHPEHTAGQRLYYEQWASAEGLLITGGSDFHGDKKDSCPYPGCECVDYSCLELIKQRWKK